MSTKSIKQTFLPNCFVFYFFLFFFSFFFLLGLVKGDSIRQQLSVSYRRGDLFGLSNNLMCIRDTSQVAGGVCHIYDKEDNEIEHFLAVLGSGIPGQGTIFAIFPTITNKMYTAGRPPQNPAHGQVQRAIERCPPHPVHPHTRTGVRAPPP